MSAIDAWVPRTAAAAKVWHAKVARAGVLKIAVALVGLIALVAAVDAELDRRGRKARLIAAVEDDRRAHPQEVALLDRVDAIAHRLASEPIDTPVVAPAFDRARLDRLLEGPGLYLRAVQDELLGRRGVHAAAAASRKDVVLACLRRPPEDASHASIRSAAIRSRWRPDLDALVPNVEDLEVLDRGLRGATLDFLAEVRATSSPTALRLLERERARSDQDLRRALHAARAHWFAIVVDERPTGVAFAEGEGIIETLRGSLLDEILPMPHAVRVAIVEANGTPLVWLRTTVDARDLRVPNVLADAEEVQACQISLAVLALAKI
jgi:hypothetical protein